MGATADGMTVDRQGNLYVTTVEGIEVFQSSGDFWGVLPVPKQPSNCTFGGSDRSILYITAREGLYEIPFEF